MEIVYKIDSVWDRELKDKEIPVEWKEQEYFIYFAKVGRRAILLFTDGSEKNLHTSTVEEISIWENGITITTRNTVYNLKSVLKGAK